MKSKINIENIFSKKIKDTVSKTCRRVDNMIYKLENNETPISRTREQKILKDIVPEHFSEIVQFNSLTPEQIKMAQSYVSKIYHLKIR